MLAASYAKINPFLEIRGKLPDNYHKVETLLVSLDLCDVIKYTLTKKQGIKLWSNLPEMRTDNNLMFRVAEQIRQRYQPSTGIEMLLQKNIPIAAGLGGGSSNAANVILALNRLWNLNMSLDEMQDIAAGLGSDISYFLHGGTCIGRGRGEEISCLDDVKVDKILLVNPGIAIPAREAYQAVLPIAESEQKMFDPAKPLNTWFNRLEQGIRDKYAKIDSILLQMQAMGADVAMMSGSGSTCFGLFDNEIDMASCREEFSWMGYWTHISKVISRDEYQSVFKA